MRPNPFLRQARVHFAMPEAGQARIDVFAVDGRCVAHLADRVFSAGAHDVAWDGEDTEGRRVAAGVYLVRIDAGSRRSLGRVARIE